MKKTLFFTVISLIFSVTILAQNNKTQKMVRIDFKDSRPDGMELQMTLPINVITSFQTQIKDAFDSLQEESQELDFVEIWRSIKETGPTDFLEVRGKDGNIKISTTESHLVAVVDSEEDGTINAQVPLALGDVLFSAGQDFDWATIIVALEQLEGQDLIKVSSEFINGRVWIE